MNTYTITYFPRYEPTVRRTATIDTLHAAYTCARALRDESKRVILHNPDGAVLLDWTNPAAPSPLDTAARFNNEPIGYESAYVFGR